jgi:hypothetical protein
VRRRFNRVRLCLLGVHVTVISGAGQHRQRNGTGKTTSDEHGELLHNWLGHGTNRASSVPGGRTKRRADYTNATGSVRFSKNDLHIVAPRTYLVLKLE